MAGPQLSADPCNKVVAIGKRRERLKDGTLTQYRADLDRRLDKLLSGPEPTPDFGAPSVSRDAA